MMIVWTSTAYNQQQWTGFVAGGVSVNANTDDGGAVPTPVKRRQRSIPALLNKLRRRGPRWRPKP